MPRSKPDAIPTLPPDQEPDELPVEPDEGLVLPDIEVDEDHERVINMPD